jgi:hypothetical protein
VTSKAGGSRLLSAAALMLLTNGCGDPLDAPSAYTEQTFLCEDERSTSRDTYTETCRADAACAGWLSFRGTLQRQFVRATARLDRVQVGNEDLAGIGRVRDSVELHAHTPYFDLRWSWSDFQLPASGVPERDWQISNRSGAGLVRSSLRMAGGGASVDLAAQSGTLRGGWTTLEHWSDLSVSYGVGNTLDGCFFARLPPGADR